MTGGGLTAGAPVKTTQYVATSGAAIALTVLVSGLMSDLWSALALHLPF